MSAGSWIALAVLGGTGAVLRFAIDGAIGGRMKGDFPYGTFAINVGGSLILGLLTGAHVSSATLFAVGAGFVGSFTTFSTWMFETQRLAEDGESSVAAANLVLSVVCGLAAGAAGWGIGALL